MIFWRRRFSYGLGRLKSTKHAAVDQRCADGRVFLLIGLEVKRELMQGSLASLRRAAFPVIAAIGGMIVPALLYLAFNYSDPVTREGWAIPAATDIAFALGVLALLGNRVPAGAENIPDGAGNHR